MGVWIETVLVDKWHIVYRGHTLRGCVDWNFPWVVFGLHLWSHPAWVCGLKLFCLVKREYQTMSHPAWVCGLKLFLIVNTVHFFWSHPAWVCGLKHDCTYSLLQISSSHPAWVCGLKLPPFSHLALRLCHTLRGCVDWNNAIPEYSNLWHVTPCVGVWIETWMNYQRGGETQVTPCVGVWIETLLEWYTTTSKKVTPCVGVWIETVIVI